MSWTYYYVYTDDDVPATASTRLGLGPVPQCKISTGRSIAAPLRDLVRPVGTNQLPRQKSIYYVTPFIALLLSSVLLVFFVPLSNYI